MRKLCIGDRKLDTYSDIGNYFRADIDKRLDKCRDFLFVIYISISIVYCILHCGGSDYFDDYYFRFLQFTKTPLLKKKTPLVEIRVLIEKKKKNKKKKKKSVVTFHPDFH